jgi:glycosyltransferase involved in cell wall biosynthesis
MQKWENKHICIVSPSLRIGGIERALVILANYFANRGVKVTFISCLKGERFYYLENTVNCIEPRFKRSARILNKIISYPLLVCYIRRNIIRTSPDAILTFGDLFSPLVLLSLFGLNYKIYISDRTSPYYKFRFPIPQLKKWLYPKSSGFIAQTKKAADFKREKFGDRLKISIIPNAIKEINLFPDIAREKIILYAGRFAWEKGPERLIRAFKAISDRQNWRLHMAGSGPLLNKMKQLVVDFNISDEVIFHGKVKEIDKLYARAGIYVLPSLVEGFPNSLCEAMAAGLPCICFDKIPFEEIFKNGVDGIAVRDDDINELSVTMAELMKNNNLRKKLGDEAKKICFRFSVDSVGQQVLNFIFED